MAEYENDGIMDWDDEIEEDGVSYTLLPEGDYNFTVIEMERSQTSGKGKLPVCPQAALVLSVSDGDGNYSKVHENIILHKSLEWKMSAFFRAIGNKKHGEKVKPKWNEVIGAVGRAHFGIEEFTKNDGTPGKKNVVRKYFDYDDKNFETGGFDEPKEQQKKVKAKTAPAKSNDMTDDDLPF